MSITMTPFADRVLRIMFGIDDIPAEKFDSTFKSTAEL